MNKKFRIYVISILVISILIVSFDFFFLKKKPIYLALVGPITGADSDVGESMKNAANLVINDLNKDGGINGHKIKLDIYDDANNPEDAELRANEIIKNNRAIAVIGHHYSTCSIRAGAVYKEKKIPAVTPVSTSIKVTKDNDWYFRTVGNDQLQSSFLANYIYQILDKKQILIIYEDLDYGKFIYSVIKDSFTALGGKVVDSMQFKSTNTDGKIYSELVDKIEVLDNDTVIFIAAHSQPGAILVKNIRDKKITNLIVGPDSFAGKDFKDKLYSFTSQNSSIKNNDFYTKNLFVASPAIFDSVNQKAQEFKNKYEKTFESKPGWRAAFTYDTLKVIAESIKNTHLDFEKTPLFDIRKAVKVELDKIIFKDGITGEINYNETGDNLDLVSIGQFKNNNLVSSFLQIDKITDQRELNKIEKVNDNDQIIKIGDSFFYKKNLVYTGVKVNEIKELDIKNMTCFLDFQIWFKYQGDINFKNFEFFNSLDSIVLDNPIEDKIYDNVKYTRFKVNGKFKIDFVKGNSLFGKHNVGLKLINNKLNINHFVFVNDLIAMEKDELNLDKIEVKSSVVNIKKLMKNYVNKIFFDDLSKESSNNSSLLSSKYKWRILNIESYQDNWTMNSFGNPDLLNSTTLKHSAYNYNIVISKNNFSIIDKFSISSANKILLISSIFLLLIHFLKQQFNFSNLEKYLLLFNIVFIYSFIISLNLISLTFFIDKIDLLQLEKIQRLFDSSKYFFAAFFTVKFLIHYIWEPIKIKTGHPVPSILRKIISFIIYIIALFSIMAYVYEKEITSLLATSGLIAMIIGLAVQMNLSNIISGIVINIERPFRIGDWIEIDDCTIGKVVDINWRAIRLEKDSNVVSIPNHVLASSKILNYDFPNENVSCNFKLKVSHEHEYDLVEKAILEAIFKIKGSVEHYVKITNSDGAGSEFSFGFRFKDYTKKYTNHSDAWKHVLNVFKKYNIRMVE